MRKPQSPRAHFRDIPVKDYFYRFLDKSLWRKIDIEREGRGRFNAESVTTGKKVYLSPLIIIVSDKLLLETN